MTIPEAMNLAGQLMQAGHPGEAESIYRQILAQNPNNPAALFHLGGILHEYGEINQAADCYRRMILLQPDSAIGHISLGLMLLAQGDLENGLVELEWRWKMPELQRVLTSLAKPMWNGSDPAGKRIFIHAERGLGDTINFVRYLPIVAERGAKIIFGCQPELHRLFGNVTPGIEWYHAGSPLPEFDVHCSLVSLPAVLKTTLTTIPNETPYLFADPELVHQWATRLGTDERLKVGLCWAGHDRSLGRSMNITDLAPLADLTNVRWISLTKGSAAKQISSAPAGLNITDWTEELHDFSDTAALAANMDLIISVDTSISHLAGALGKPVWVVFKRAPDWRWMIDRADSPWYPTATLFRQPRPGDWQTPMNQIAERLKNAAREKFAK